MQHHRSETTTPRAPHTAPGARLTVRHGSSEPNRCLTLAVCGEMDAASVSALSDATCRALAEGRRRLRLDLSAVTSCDNASLYTILGVWHALHTAGGGLTLTAPSTVVQAAVRNSRIARLLPLTQTPDA